MTFSVVRWIPAVDTAVIPVRQTCWRLACQQRNDGYRYRCSVGRMKPCQVGLLRMVRWPLGAEHCWSAAAAAKIASVGDRAVARLANRGRSTPALAFVSGPEAKADPVPLMGDHSTPALAFRGPDECRLKPGSGWRQSSPALGAVGYLWGSPRRPARGGSWPREAGVRAATGVGTHSHVQRRVSAQRRWGVLRPQQPQLWAARMTTDGGRMGVGLTRAAARP